MAYLQITLRVEPSKRSAAAAVYALFKPEFLRKIEGARAKSLLMRDEDVQVLHEFDTSDQARSYLKSPLFEQHVATALHPLLTEPPEIRIYAMG